MHEQLDDFFQVRTKGEGQLPKIALERHQLVEKTRRAVRVVVLDESYQMIYISANKDDALKSFSEDTSFTEKFYQFL